MPAAISSLLIPSREAEKARTWRKRLPRPSAGLPSRGAAAAPAGRTLLDDTAIARALTRIAHEILERNEDVSQLYLVAIPNGGVPLARRLAGSLRQIADVDVPVGVLDTTLYRDDLKMTGERPLLRRTEMPSAVDERVVVLVDDVVKTGRTIRAAMDALMDFGRPRMVQVVGLVDRGHRELPIKLDYVGKNVPTSPRETVCLRGRDGGPRGSPRGGAAARGSTGGGMIGRDLLGIEDLERSEIERILQTAIHMREVGEREVKKVPTLRGRTIVNLFFESSTRTRASFEIAGKRLSADVVNFSPSSSSMKKAESILDTARTLDAMDPDAVIVRHEVAGVPKAIADVLDAPVINAGDGAHEHPTQALLDLFTVQQEKGRIDGLTVTIVGDILHSRVARSNIYGFLKMGAEVRVAAPPPMIPPAIEELGVKAYTSLREALDGADVVMALRIQNERLAGSYFPSVREYAATFGLDRSKLHYAKEDAIVMHPGPVNRGVELSHDLADHRPSVILDQVRNGVAIRMAVLYLFAGRKREHGQTRRTS